MSLSKLENLVHQSFDEFYRQRILKLTGVKLSDLFRKKNLYLLCATSGSSVSKIVEKMLEEYLSQFKEFVDAWAKALNRFEHDFLNNFGNPDGSIDWEKLLRYNRGKDNVPWVTKVIPVTSAEDQEDESNEDEIGDVDDGIEDYA